MPATAGRPLVLGIDIDERTPHPSRTELSIARGDRCAAGRETQEGAKAMATRERTYPGHTHSSEPVALGAPATPVPLMQIATGFWAFKTLAAAHELDLFTRLAGGAETTAQELAGELGIEQRPAEMLLTGCASLGLLERGHRGYRNTALSERFLVRGTPYYFGGLVTMFDRRLYPGWAKLAEAIRTNRPTTWDPERERSMFEREDPAVLETFWEAMDSLSGFTARTLGDAIDLDAATRLLDVGGGSGAFAIELCRRYPSLSATVFDLPHVIDIAAHKIADAQLRGAAPRRIPRRPTWLSDTGRVQPSCRARRPRRSAGCGRKPAPGGRARPRG
jgi:hypothetical protein